MQIEKDEATLQCAAERRRAVAAETQGQQRLLGALRRLDYLVRCCPIPSSYWHAGAIAGWHVHEACSLGSTPPADAIPVCADAVLHALGCLACALAIVGGSFMDS